MLFAEYFEIKYSGSDFKTNNDLLRFLNNDGWRDIPIKNSWVTNECYLGNTHFIITLEASAVFPQIQNIINSPDLFQEKIEWFCDSVVEKTNLDWLVCADWVFFLDDPHSNIALFPEYWVEEDCFLFYKKVNWVLYKYYGKQNIYWWLIF